MTHFETDRINSVELNSLYNLSGVGFGASIGFIYRPVQALRLGASFQTPTMMMLSVQTEGDIHSTIHANKYEYQTPASGTITSEMLAPLRTSVSVAGQIGNIGLISIQHDYAHAADHGQRRRLADAPRGHRQRRGRHGQRHHHYRRRYPGKA